MGNFTDFFTYLYLRSLKGGSKGGALGWSKCFNFLIFYEAFTAQIEKSLNSLNSSLYIEREWERERARQRGREGGRERGPAVKDEEAASQTPRFNNVSNCRRKECVKFNGFGMVTALPVALVSNTFSTFSSLNSFNRKPFNPKPQNLNRNS